MQQAGLTATDKNPIGPRDYRVTINLGIVLAAWTIFVVLAPLLWQEFPWLAVLSVITIGGYLYTWLLYYRHELWHNYFPGIDNQKALNVVSYVILAIPEAYRLCHASHHKYVHTDQDMEFFCQDYATDRRRKRRQFILELFFGNIAWEWGVVLRLSRAGRLSARARIAARVASLAFVGLGALFAHRVKPGVAPYVFLTFVLTAWLGALVTRHTQWIEHLGILENDLPLHERDMLSRNLPNDTWLARLVNFYTHDDARDHVLHHTKPGWNSRGVSGIALPPGARTTTIREHMSRLRRHFQSL